MSAEDPGALAGALLAWYDAHARKLPWRIGPADRAAGARPDPYRVWLSEIMLQQTTTVHAAPYFLRFTARWPTVRDLAAAEDAEVMAAWAGLGYYARARNLLACARTVAGAGGDFPDTETGLRALPGVGPYTAAAVAAIAFDRPATVVDGNVERVTARLFAEETPLPAAKPRLTALAARLTPAQRPGDFAQAMMDLGATVCTPRAPACPRCPWAGACAARARGIAESLPAKTPRAAKPHRHGAVFVAVTPAGRLLLERRPDKGLLGGMQGLPGTDWTGTPPDAAARTAAAPLTAAWRSAPTPARHVFTHFSLTLEVLTAVVPESIAPDRGAFAADARAQLDRLPTVFRKALAIGLDALAEGPPKQ